VIKACEAAGQHRMPRTSNRSFAANRRQSANLPFFV
jgi:hypothetical protein